MEEWIVVLPDPGPCVASPPSVQLLLLSFSASFLLWPSASFPFLLQPLLPLLLFPLLVVSFVGSPSFAAPTWCGLEAVGNRCMEMEWLELVLVVVCFED